MSQVCTRCGARCDEAGARFCPLCGGALAPEAGPSAASAGPRCSAHPDVEAEFTCSRCGSFACANCRRAGPDGAALCASCHTRVDASVWHVPWESRAQLGLRKAYWQTAKAGTFNPNTVYAGLRPEGSWWDPVSFGVLSLVISTVSGVLLVGGSIALAAFFGLSSKGSNELGQGLLVLVGGTIGVGVAVFLMAVLRIIFGAGLDHICLLLLGSAKGGFSGTLRGYCYSFAPAFWGLIPGCGVYITEVWRMVAAVYAYRAVHRTTGTRAAIAVLAPWLLACGLYMVMAAGLSAMQAASEP